MKLDVAYVGRSRLANEVSGTSSLRFAANVQRETVAFDAALRTPLRFREAISALHDVVISDLRFKPRNREAYQVWKKQQAARDAQLRRSAYEQLKREILQSSPEIAPDFEQKYQEKLRRYWRLRSKFSLRLMLRNPEMWRLLLPCDPVVTVADDVVLFECFSADQSSYGCLSCDRGDAFGESANLRLGTTNVDYSWAMYDHFQSLRSYRETRLQVDPGGVDVITSGGAGHHEEKIDIPDGWLRGFMQLQSAMTMPMRRVTLSRDAVYSILAWLRRHKPRTSPRAMRFELVAGQPPSIVLEPWEQRIVSQSTVHQEASAEPIRIWGARRVLALARILPLMDACDVYLLGTGLPSFWVARMGEMRLTLGLSGWTANDWSAGSALDALLPPGHVSDFRVRSAISLLQRERALSFDALQAKMICGPGDCAATLNQLALSGQVIHDLDANVFRWRQVMPLPIDMAELADVSPELVAAHELLRLRRVQINERVEQAANGQLISGRVDGQQVELVLDRDGVILRGKCACSHHHRAGIRRGPCQHLLALRAVAMRGQFTEDNNNSAWFDRLLRWSQN